MKYGRYIVIVLFLQMVFLSGCYSQISTHGSGIASDPFTSSNTIPSFSVSPTESLSGEIQAPYTADSLSGGDCGLSLLYENKESETYSGGELRVSYYLNLEGDHIDRDGVGILLFLDGQPQPYRTEFDATYQYMHVVYPENGVGTHVNLYFVPIVGQTGQQLELWATNMVFPYVGARWDNVAGGKTLTAFGSRLVIDYAATPLQTEVLEIADRLISWNVTLKEVRKSEVNPRWTAEDLMNKVDYVLYTEGASSKSKYYIHSFTGDQPLKLRFEMWGNPLLQWGLVIFVDHVPISVSPEDVLQFQTEAGMKTVVELEVDLSDFGNESIIYAMFIPRNRDAIGANAVFMRPTTHQFVLRASTWEEFLQDNN